MIDGDYTLIGHTAERRLADVPFMDAYPGFLGTRVELAIDAGLIAVEDANDWTTQVFGVGRARADARCQPRVADLELVGTPVKAFGAASGALDGRGHRAVLPLRAPRAAPSTWLTRLSALEPDSHSQPDRVTRARSG